MDEKSILVPDGDVLLIVPPFSILHRPPLGVHVLQACGREVGFGVGILYSNLNFAANVGVKTYRSVSDIPFGALAGERTFVASAYEVPPLGWDAEELLENVGAYAGENDVQDSPLFRPFQLAAEAYLALEARARKWVEEVARAVAAGGFKVVGCTTMFEQTAASVALLKRIKQLRPEIVTIIGGPNCEDEMAEGIASLSTEIDHVFSGESEQTFVDFLRQVFAGERPEQRIFYGQPCQDLDSLPTPDFSQYYQQLDYYLPDRSGLPAIELAYETSRGCWWGQKHHCTFCGLNGQGMGFRQKSPQKVLRELRQLLAQHPSQSVLMTHNIMPYTFFKTLVPDLSTLAEEMPNLTIFYEQKANLSLEQVMALMAAGINHIQPGIEALSSSLLRRMDKGVSAAQNVALLRYACSTGMSLSWNLLNGFPGDTREEYEETLALIPLLHHLQPPSGFFHLSIDRFSPYFERPEAYGVSNLRPWDTYENILPRGVDTTQVAYHFTADYDCATRRHPELIGLIEQAMGKWRSAWEEKTLSLFFGQFKINERPLLEVTRLDGNYYQLRDTRGLPGTQSEYELTHEQAAAALAPRRYLPTPEIEWALAHKVGVVLDNHQYVPLATAEPELMLQFESEVRRVKSRQPLFDKVIPLTTVV